MKEIYLMRKSDCRWHLTNEQRQQVLDRCMAILNNPNSNARSCGIAAKNILMMNNQNIQTCDDAQTDQKIEIVIKEQ